MSQRAGEVDDDVVDAVLASSRALIALSARSIAGAPGVTLPQFRMLVVLSGNSTNLSGLAAALDVAPSTAMRMVDRLIAGDLVQRSIRPDNRRETQLSLTSQGRRVVRTVTTRRRRDLSAVIAQLPASEQTALMHAMAAFADAADRIWPGAAGTIT